MSSVLNQLEEKQGLLLMYLADELPPGDRGEVERMLAVDAGLRGELDQLRETQGWFAETMARADASTRPAVSEGAAVRRVGRAMRQWHARRLAAAPTPRQVGSTLRYPWWAYPLAAAASVVIAFLVWWGNTDMSADRTVLVRGDRGAVMFPTAEPGDGDAAIQEVDAGEMIAWSLGVGEFSFDGYGPGGPTDWDDAGSLYAAVAPSDANVLMLLNDNNAAEDNEAAPEDESTFQ